MLKHTRNKKQFSATHESMHVHQWVPVQKTRSPLKLKMLAPSCNQTVNLETDATALYYSLVLLLLVCMWRHGGHVGGQEQKHFSPLWFKLHFHVNSSRKNSKVLTPNTAALSRGCKPRIYLKHKKDQNEYASLKNNHRNHTNRIFYQKIFKSIDRLFFASYGTHAMNHFASLGIFLRQGCRTQR